MSYVCYNWWLIVCDCCWMAWCLTSATTDGWYSSWMACCLMSATADGCAFTLMCSFRTCMTPLSVWRSSLVVSPWCCHDVGLSMVSQVVQPESNYVFVCYLNHKIKRFFWLTDLRMDSNGAFQSMIKSSVHWIYSLTAQVNVLCVISFWVVCIIVLAAIFVLLFWLLSSLASYTEVHVTCYSVFHLYHQRNVICGQFL